MQGLSSRPRPAEIAVAAGTEIRFAFLCKSITLAGIMAYTYFIIINLKKCPIVMSFTNYQYLVTLLPRFHFLLMRFDDSARDVLGEHHRSDRSHGDYRAPHGWMELSGVRSSHPLHMRPITVFQRSSRCLCTRPRRFWGRYHSPMFASGWYTTFISGSNNTGPHHALPFEASRPRSLKLRLGITSGSYHHTRPYIAHWYPRGTRPVALIPFSWRQIDLTIHTTTHRQSNHFMRWFDPG